MNIDSRYGIILPKENDTKIVATVENDESTLFIKPPGNRRYSRIILDFSDDTDESSPDAETSNDDSENLLRYEPTSGDLVQSFRETIELDPPTDDDRDMYVMDDPSMVELLIEPAHENDSPVNEPVRDTEELPEINTDNSDEDLGADYADVEQRMMTLSSEISGLIVKAEQMLTNSEKRMNEIEAEIREHVRRNELRHENSEKLLRELDEDLKGHMRINELWRENSETMLKEIVSDVKDHVRRNDERHGQTDGMLQKIVSNTDDLSRKHVEEVQFLYDELQKREKDLFREIQLPVALDFIDVINNLRSILIQSKNMNEEYRPDYFARELESCVKFADGRLGNRRITAFSDLKDTNNPPKFNDARHVIERRGIVYTRNRSLHNSLAESISPGYEWFSDDSRSRVIRKETVRIFEYRKEDEFHKHRS